MPGKDQDRRLRYVWIGAIVVAFVAAWAFVGYSSAGNHNKVESVSFYEFLGDLDAGKIEQVEVSEKNHTLVATRGEHTVKATYPANFPLSERLEEYNEFADSTSSDEYEATPYTYTSARSGGGSTLILLGIVAFIIVLILFSRSRMQGQKSGNGSPARVIAAGEVPVSFKDVAGCDEVVEELAEIREFLSDPDRFRALGATIPKGVLLFGPPGTGKTLLARAVAGEAGVPFFSISGSDFVEMYVGVGASRVRKLFESAKEQAPCVIFIDEIDAVGRRRSGSSQGGQEERENTLNQLLVEIDGFSPNDNVIVMAASNRADILDPALTRPGRFDRQVIVDVPDRVGREAILAVHGKGKPFAKDVDLKAIAAQTAGFAGADLANLVNEAALLAARSSRKSITHVDVDEATMRVMAGPQKNRVMSDREKLVTAAHEMGHAIVAHDLPGAEPVHKVTIVGRGRALGLTVMLQEEDKLLRTRSELMSQMAVALGGRVAEEIMFGEITTGASNDLEKVNQIAQTMVLKLGMSDEFALRAYMMEDRLSVHSDGLSSKIDAEIDRIVSEAKLMAQEILLDKRELLESITDQLIERETLNREEFEALMRGEELAPLPHPVEQLEAEEQAEAEREAAAAAAAARESDDTRLPERVNDALPKAGGELAA